MRVLFGLIEIPWSERGYCAVSAFPWGGGEEKQMQWLIRRFPFSWLKWKLRFLLIPN